MIDKVKGKIEKKYANHVIIEVGGFGIKIRMSINSIELLPSVGKHTEVLTYLNVREDLLDLYGFVNETERETFGLLISISGIGPKLALTILSGVNTSDLKDSIIAGDVGALTKIPGIGSKTAKRIIIELKEKFINIDSEILGITEDKEMSDLSRDTINALTALGYKSNHAKTVCAELEKDGLMKGELGSVIKQALGKLMQ